MKKIIYICDKCGKEITGGLLQIVPHYIDKASGDYEEKQMFEAQFGRHYCEECTRKVMSLLEAPAAEVYIPEAGEAKEEEQKEEGSEEDGDPDEEKPPEKKNPLIKVSKLPKVREYKKRGIDKEAVYGDFLEMQGDKKAYSKLAYKYGCTRAYIGQIVKEFSQNNPDPPAAEYINIEVSVEDPEDD